MNPEALLEAMGEIDDGFVKEAEELHPVRRSKRWIVFLAAAVALLAALSITAYATDFFGIVRLIYTPYEEDLGAAMSLQGYADSVESQAYLELMTTGGNIREIAEKYGLTANVDAAVLPYEELVENIGGAYFNDRHSRNAGYMYGDGTFSTDGEYYALADGMEVNYQLVRCVRGSLTDIMLNIGDIADYEEWNYTVDGYTLALTMKDTKSLIVADLESCFVTLNVLIGTEDGWWGGGMTRELLEELADSIYWDVLAEIRTPHLVFEEDPIYGPGVALDPAYVIEPQSFLVPLAGWGEIHFISYAPTADFEDVRFFLSRDGVTSDYELHPVFTGQTFEQVAAVSFEDVTGDDRADIIVLIDYLTAIGDHTREARIFKAFGNGEFDIEWEMTNGVNAAIAKQYLTIGAVRDFLGVGGPDKTETPVEPVKLTFTDMLDTTMVYDDGSMGWNYSRYSFFDFTGDGTPELIAFIADLPAAGFSADVYTVENGDVKWLGNLELAQSDLFFAAEDGRLLQLYAHMGYEALYEVTWDGLGFKQELLSERYLGADEAYSAPGRQLVFVDNQDRSLLRENDGNTRTYEDILKETYREFDGQDFYLNYYVHDLTGDGVKELMVWAGLTPEAAVLRIYTLENGGAVRLGASISGYGSVFADTDGSILIESNHVNGLDTSIFRYTWNGSYIQANVIPSYDPETWEPVTPELPESAEPLLVHIITDFDGLEE